MRNREKPITRSIPLTVTYSVNGQVKKKRFKEVESAWSFLRLVGGANGSLCFGFRIG